MSSDKVFSVVNIPLNRPEIVDFLTLPIPENKGSDIRIIGQRPAPENERLWIDLLHKFPDVKTILKRDDPHTQFTKTSTGRLIPVHFLKQDPEFLTRNLGGWSPVYFAVIEASPSDWKTDPLLNHAETLSQYGKRIHYFGADHVQVGMRLGEELGVNTPNEAALGIIRLHEYREDSGFLLDTDSMIKFADDLYRQIVSNGALSQPSKSGAPAVPRPVLIDELIGQMIRLELLRRHAEAEEDKETVEKIGKWQEDCRSETGLFLLLKGEYIMGRHRRSTILIAPELGFVAKQPGPEPFHEALIGQRTYNGKPENMPSLTRDAALVTACGRLRLIIEDGLIEKLNRLFHHEIQLISSLGFIIEPFVTGPTLQEYILEKPERLTKDVYGFVLLHQQVCEAMGVENGDWHAANFIVMPEKPNPLAENLPAMIHIDWGAARPLLAGELTTAAVESRLNQVRNIAFSFHDKALAERTKQLHDEVTGDEMYMRSLQSKARELVDNYK